MSLGNLLKQFRNSGTVRSMGLNVLIRPISILINIIYTPLLLNYLGDEKYGIWVTILSIINWVNFCDIGIGNGLRNILGKEIVKSQFQEARKTVSTAYMMLSLIAFGMIIILGLFSYLFNWKFLFDTEVSMEPIMLISFSFIAINFVFALGKSILYAIQRSEIVSLLTVLSSFLQLIGIFFLQKVSEGSLVKTTILFGASTTVVLAAMDVLLAKNSNVFSPKINLFDKTKVKDLCSLGILFLILQIGGIVMNSTDNVLVSKYFGPAIVTPFSTAARFFTCLLSFYMALIIPVWSRITKAINENDIDWIKKIFIILNVIMLIVSSVMIIVSFFFRKLSFIWLGRELDYSNGLIFVTVLACIVEMVSMTYSHIMNGLSLLKVQAVVAVFQSVVNVPLSVYLATDGGMGIVGIKAATVIMFVISSVIYCVYLIKYMNKTEVK